MPNLDDLYEKLKLFDEVTLLEVLNLNTEDILERFRDVVYSRREYLFGECELLVEGEELEEMIDDEEGFQIEHPFWTEE